MHRILILEDEEVLGKLYKKNLEAAGYAVEWVETVEEAEEMAEEFRPHLVLVDHGIRNQDKSGLDLIHLVRDRFPETKLIMLSNYSHSKLRQEVMAAGASEFLIKLNTSPKALVRKIEVLFS